MGLRLCGGGYTCSVNRYAVGFARPDRSPPTGRGDQAQPWHAVEAHRPALELDGEVELAVCGALVQVWGRQDWNRVGAGQTACAECRLLTASPAPAAGSRAAGSPAADGSASGAPAGQRAGGRRLRIVN
jgi:hypothetical protein